ncbi:MAG: hypothetical protein ABJB55_02955 [Actinomycetota bacterium]
MKIARLIAAIVGLSLVAIATPAWAASGDPDTGFSGDGVMNFGLAVGEESGVGAVVDPSGRLLVGDYLSGTDLAVARVLPGGTLDSSFAGGIAQFPEGKNRPTNAIAVQPNGKVLVVGQTPNADLYLARYRANGLPDPTFSGDGLVHVALPSTSTTETSIFVRSDGSIVIPGYVTNASNEERLFVVAFRPNGSLDPSFSGDGQFFLQVGDTSRIRDALIDGHDRVTVAGETQTNGRPQRALVARILANGTLDRNFAGDGVALFDLAGGADEPRAIDALGGGSALVVEQGVNAGGTSANAISFAVSAAGKIDMSYSGDGRSTIDLDVFDNPADLWIDGSGRGYIATSLPYLSATVPSLIRTNPNGSLDNSFSGDGYAQVTTEGIGGAVTVWHGKPTLTGGLFLTTDFDAMVARFLA